MGIILDNSVAAGVSIEVKNVPLAFSGEVLARKILIIATALSSYADKHIMGTPFLVLSPEDVASKCGPGSMAHRLAIAAFRGSGNAVPVCLLVEADISGATFAKGTFTLSVSAPQSGTLALYVAGKKYGIPVQPTDTATLLGGRIAAAITADQACPVSADNVDGVITFTSKSAGPWATGSRLPLTSARPKGKKSRRE
ncbi:MAG: hypothetical protein LBD47_01565 [Treponema sp.]|jgi:phage tail sheath gpL-like|nr:hypothetical protein [Treponema sp.]